MTHWTQYLNEREPLFLNKKKQKKSGCKRNRISKFKNGPCSFNEQDECVFCKRPRKKEHRFDPATNTIVVHYFE